MLVVRFDTDQPATSGPRAARRATGRVRAAAPEPRPRLAHKRRGPGSVPAARRHQAATGEPAAGFPALGAAPAPLDRVYSRGLRVQMQVDRVESSPRGVPRLR